MKIINVWGLGVSLFEHVFIFVNLIVQLFHFCHVFSEKLHVRHSLVKNLLASSLIWSFLCLIRESFVYVPVELLGVICSFIILFIDVKIHPWIHFLMLSYLIIS